MLGGLGKNCWCIVSCFSAEMWLTFPLEYGIKRAWSHFVGHTHGGALGDLFYPSAEQIRLALPFMPNLWSCMCTYIPGIISQCHWLDVMIFSCHPQRAVLITRGQLFSSLLLMLLPAAWLWHILQRAMCLCLSHCCDHPKSLYLWTLWQKKKDWTFYQEAFWSTECVSGSET